MVVTYNNIIKVLEDFADNHKQINTFFSGKLADYQANSNIYTSMIVFPSPGNFNLTTTIVNLQVYVVDILNQDISNLDEIRSDTKQIIEDLISYINYNYEQNNIDFGLADGDIALNPHMEKFDDTVAGWSINLALQHESTNNCDIPIVPIEPPIPPEPVDCNNPLESDVREGVIYGEGSVLEGSLAVPDPSQVLAGVPTDDTVGTYEAETRTTAKLMKTGQSISYRTGDDGDLQSGRDVDFFTLAENNPFGNTNRFTDEFGGQDYILGIKIDWATFNGSSVLGWGVYSVGYSWNSAIDYCLAYTLGTFISGWYLPNRDEMLSLIIAQPISFLSYAPFSLSAVLRNLTSTTDPYITSNAEYITGPSQRTGVVSKTTSSSANACMPVREFTVTGTVLT